jgi:hypothetical protein
MDGAVVVRACGNEHPLNFNADEASILTENNILVPPGWHLTHGWNISAGGYTMPPNPAEEPSLDAYIEHRRKALPLEQRGHLDWAANSVLWLPLFQ